MLVMKRDADDEEDELEPQQALPVPESDAHLDENHVPATAEEYLLMVRRQASRVPDIVCKPIDPSQVRKVQPHIGFDVEIPDCPVECLPNLAWERKFCQEFRALRDKVTR